MPIYDYKCKKCGIAVGILRGFEGYKDTPSDEEVSTQHPDVTDKCEHEWDKQFGTGEIRLIKWPNSTGPVKGTGN